MRFRLIGFVVLLSLLSGCSPAVDPLDQPIDATTAQAYNRWLYQTVDKLTPAHRARYEKAVQQLGLELSVANPIRSAAQRTEDLNSLLNDASARQVIAWVELLGINRLDLETRIDREMLRANFVQLGNVREGSDLSISSSIRNQIAAIEERMRERETKIDETQAKLAALMPQLPAETWKSSVTTTSDVPIKVLTTRVPSPRDLMPKATTASANADE